MPDATLAFDHVHVIARDPQAAARWYIDKLGGTVVSDAVVRGAPQIYISLGGAMVIVRGQRPGEHVTPKPSLEWGVDHFGLQVKGDFEAYCNDLKRRGVTFNVEPRDANPTTRIAFIDAPDGVSVELLSRRDAA